MLSGEATNTNTDAIDLYLRKDHKITDFSIPEHSTGIKTYISK